MKKAWEMPAPFSWGRISWLHHPHVYYIKGDGYNGLMELQTKPAGGIFRGLLFRCCKKAGGKNREGLLPLAVKRKPNKAPNESAEIAHTPFSPCKRSRRRWTGGLPLLWAALWLRGSPRDKSPRNFHSTHKPRWNALRLQLLASEHFRGARNFHETATEYAVQG